MLSFLSSLSLVLIPAHPEKHISNKVESKINEIIFFITAPLSKNVSKSKSAYY
jgi:hypothetical protein